MGLFGQDKLDDKAFKLALDLLIKDTKGPDKEINGIVNHVTLDVNEHPTDFSLTAYANDVEVTARKKGKVLFIYLHKHNQLNFSFETYGLSAFGNGARWQGRTLKGIWVKIDLD